MHRQDTKTQGSGGLVNKQGRFQFGAPAAFSLVEVTVALGITAFCLLSIFGLLPIALKSNQAAVEQTAANSILTAVAADLRATPPASSPGQAVTSQQFSISIPGNPATNTTAYLYFSGDGKSLPPSPSSSPIAPVPADSRYLVTVKFLSGSSGKAATNVNVQASWPAATTLANAAGSVQTFVALDRN